MSQGPNPEEAVVTYRYSGSIAAPSAEEAPDYTAGTDVTIAIVTDDGQQLREWTTNVFPSSVNFNGIQSAGGTITMTYTVTKPGETTQGSDEGIVTGAPTTETKSFTRRIEFEKE